MRFVLGLLCNWIYGRKIPNCGMALTSSSEQQFVDCDTAMGNEGCTAGEMDAAIALR
jgi:hypothetical protein